MVQPEVQARNSKKGFQESILSSFKEWWSLSTRPDSLPCLLGRGWAPKKKQITHQKKRNTPELISGPKITSRHRNQSGDTKTPTWFQQSSRKISKTFPVFQGAHFRVSTPQPQRLKPNRFAVGN